MERRQFLRVGPLVASTAVVGTAGCVSKLSSRTRGATGIEVHEFEVWNEDDVAHTFDVSVSVAGEESAFERTVELGASSESTFTREELSGAPDSSVTEVEMVVGDQRARKDLTQYGDSVATVSFRCSREGELAVMVYP
ncbi:hypothetical protein [Halorussus ruber]|uniref:hypothetical protein n=1 Tax=Halorussus ruber TaxID=1126238 RepID=UPI001091E35B|nr:hypothetical protein [Halorussus ruber]